jgi:4-hydroxy-L-threonine phosphate dehydrogenase PdxA|tara:strand:+ start:142 stop:1107 length:966 start_codon:yes stop_codon:yes gene_type:complete
MKNKIIIVTGDPNSINSELIYKSWKKINISLKKKIVLISNYKLLKEQFKKLNYPIKITKIDDLDAQRSNSSLKIIDIKLNFTNSFKVSKKNASKFVIKSLNYAHKLALNKDYKGLINCAISKKLLRKNNFGVTEYLASKNNVKKNSEVMLIRNDNLSVSPITTHLDIKNISKKLNSDLIINKVDTIEFWFKKYFNKKPKIAMLGLNPHNAELRNNSEERKVIIPSILMLKRKGVNITGPLVADTLFIEDYKKYDVIVGMFHDQVITPFKTLFKFNAINVTLGLNYLRVSPDHGVAENLIGKNKANSTSLINCINFVNKFDK